MNQSILKELTFYYYELLESQIKANNLNLVIEYRSILQKLINDYDSSQKLENRLQKMDPIIAEAIADFDVELGKRLNGQQQFLDASERFKSAFERYDLLNNQSKKKSAKNAFLDAKIQEGKDISHGRIISF